MNIAHLFSDAVRERSAAQALIEGEGDKARRTTFAALDRDAWQVVSQLQRDGIRAGDSIVFFAAPSRELYAALIATWRLGAIAMFVEPSAGHATLNAACVLRPPTALIASPKAHLLRLLSPALRAIPHKYQTGGIVPGAARLGRVDAPFEAGAIADVASDDAALVTFTSGSTGQPKGAIRTHAILRAQMHALRAVLPPRPGEREMVALPIVVLLTLANGAETVLPMADLRRPGAIDPAPVLRQIAFERVTRITASPALLERLVDSPLASDALQGLETIVSGGGPVFPDLIDRLMQLAPRATITSVYGSTEAEPIAHITHRDVTAADRHGMEHGSGLLTGTPDAIVRLRIVRSLPGVPLVVTTTAQLDALTLGTAKAGEIIVAGPHVVSGYVNGIGEQETKCRVDGVVWHRTGDLGHLDETGRLWLLGRANAATQDDRRAPFYPFAVECAARLLLNVRRVAALTLGERRILALEGRHHSETLVEQAQQALQWAQLDEVRVVSRIPMDRRHNSKVDYPRLKRLLSE